MNKIVVCFGFDDMLEVKCIWNVGEGFVLFYCFIVVSKFSFCFVGEYVFSVYLGFVFCIC